MYMRKINNEWFTGLHTPYNKEQDKTRKPIKDKITAGTFIKDDDYDDYGYSLYNNKVRYKHYSETKATQEYAPNAKKRTYAHRIETSDERVVFSYKDRFKLQTQEDDENGYMVVNVEINKNPNSAKKAIILPGLAKQSAPKTLLTLR